MEEERTVTKWRKEMHMKYWSQNIKRTEETIGRHVNGNNDDEYHLDGDFLFVPQDASASLI
jgi:hypothetical protein